MTKKDVSDALLGLSTPSAGRLAELDLNADGKLDVADLVFHVKEFAKTNWQGTLDIQSANVGFSLEILKTTTGYQGKLKSDGYGAFPAGEWNAQITIGADSFTATIDPILVPTDVTLFQVELRHTLQLTANSSIQNFLVSPPQILGQVSETIVATHPEQQHLNRTIQGSFRMLRQGPAIPADPPLSRVD